MGMIAGSPKGFGRGHFAIIATIEMHHVGSPSIPFEHFGSIFPRSIHGGNIPFGGKETSDVLWKGILNNAQDELIIDRGPFGQTRKNILLGSSFPQFPNLANALGLEE
eukprot:CAMPEP_0172452190 /NCGR_PEP_ID=MMETSP1065-20121228/9928_1 /TAXON_ID=265537 /ORGANISM="Amphiprora paludosa, Strain CCMP125" /LENGTH=107 /DNA_ID=CAMNT_0013204215 /DNA_START=511 /DNA_END=834 /DNA_ORIENTATION=-